MFEIEASWQTALQEELRSSHYAGLIEFVRGEYAAGRPIYPHSEDIFKAFDMTPFGDVRVVILGQDPYHGEIDGQPQAQGLSFSVSAAMRNPPSLQNIFKEVESDTGTKSQAQMKHDGDLTCWAEQGVLLLNAVLTVERGNPGSHANRGWEQLTDAAIQKLSSERGGIVFMLWGAYARKKNVLIDTDKHLILESPHPSPFSARTGFFGSKPFTQANDYMQVPIIW